MASRPELVMELRRTMREVRRADKYHLRSEVGTKYVPTAADVLDLKEAVLALNAALDSLVAVDTKMGQRLDEITARP